MNAFTTTPTDDHEPAVSLSARRCCFATITHRHGHVAGDVAPRRS
jgi:hypothetical protein